MASLHLTTPALQSPKRALSVGQLQADRLFREVIILVLASTLSLLLYWSGLHDPLRLFIPLLMLVLNAVMNFRMVVDDPAMLLTPLFGVRLSAMVVFGIGGLFDFLAPLEARLDQDYLFPTTNAEAARVNLLWLLGLTVLMVGAMVAMRLHRKSPSISATEPTSRAISLDLGILIFAVASGIQIVRVLLAELGVNFPGIVANLVTAFQLCGLFFIGQHVGESKKARIVLVSALALLFAFALLWASKTLFLYPALVGILGTLSNRVTWRATLAGAALLLLSFIIMAPMVSYTRIRMADEYGTGTVTPIEARISYLMDYARGDRLEQSGVGFTLLRLDYVMPASFVMAQYDQGLGSPRLASSAFIFIPRLIWPDKPETTTSGNEVNYALGLQYFNNIGVTIFADLYWAIGWYGLALIAAFGLYVGAISIVCEAILRSGDWVMIPFTFASMQLGLNLDSDFTAGIMAPAVINFVLLAGLAFVGHFLRHLPKLVGA